VVAARGVARLRLKGGGRLRWTGCECTARERTQWHTARAGGRLCGCAGSSLHSAITIAHTVRPGANICVGSEHREVLLVSHIAGATSGLFQV
jgi:hypothetical protein